MESGVGKIYDNRKVFNILNNDNISINKYGHQNFGGMDCSGKSSCMVKFAGSNL